METTPTPPIVAPMPLTAVVAPSPTGIPVLSQTFVRWIAPVVAVLALVGFAPDTLKEAGLDMPTLPAAVLAAISICKVLAVLLGGFFGIRSQGLRVGAVAPVLMACLWFSSCAHVDTVAVTGDSLVAAGKTFEAVDLVFVDLCARQVASEKQCAEFTTFAKQFRVEFHEARILYDAAAAYGDTVTLGSVEGILSNFLSELALEQAQLQQILNADGGR